MSGVPKDSYLLLTVLAVVFMVYYLATKGIHEMPPGYQQMMMTHPDDIQDGLDGTPSRALNGMEILRNPKRGPKVDHNIRGPIYNFNIPGLSEGWITLSDKSRVYKITVTPLGQVSDLSPSVLLLHASQYSPYAWVETGLLFRLRDAGFRGVAVDLPGHHASNHLPKLTDQHEHLAFLTDILQSEQLGEAVIVAPEVSAWFVLPLVTQHPRWVRSLMLVSPQHGFNYSTLAASQVPTLLITGEFEHAQIKRYTSPHIEHIVMPLSANFFFVENSKQFNNIVIKYLNRLMITPHQQETHTNKSQPITKQKSRQSPSDGNIPPASDL